MLRGLGTVWLATELKNGRGLLLQFHPELMGNELGALIIKKALHQKNKVLAPFCGRVFDF
jgi:putative glutamine amidotransferase